MKLISVRNCLWLLGLLSLGGDAPGATDASDDVLKPEQGVLVLQMYGRSYIEAIAKLMNNVDITSPAIVLLETGDELSILELKVVGDAVRINLFSCTLTEKQSDVKSYSKPLPSALGKSIQRVWRIELLKVRASSGDYPVFDGARYHFTAFSNGIHYSGRTNSVGKAKANSRLYNLTAVVQIMHTYVKAEKADESRHVQDLGERLKKLGG